jgi:nucleolar protein 58
MNAIAPNLTALVGDLVGARLISHAGSLLSLAKHPASTVQILGAEKALFRALKTKHDTPKYGLIYHVRTIFPLTFYLVCLTVGFDVGFPHWSGTAKVEG